MTTSMKTILIILHKNSLIYLILCLKIFVSRVSGIYEMPREKWHISSCLCTYVCMMFSKRRTCGGLLAGTVAISESIFTILSGSRRSFGLDIGFIDHFYTQLLIALNYNAIADFHILQITTPHASILSLLLDVS
jgi:hypothetical protein